MVNKEAYRVIGGGSAAVGEPVQVGGITVIAAGSKGRQGGAEADLVRDSNLALTEAGLASLGSRGGGDEGEEEGGGGELHLDGLELGIFRRTGARILGFEGTWLEEAGCWVRKQRE